MKYFVTLLSLGFLSLAQPFGDDLKAGQSLSVMPYVANVAYTDSSSKDTGSIMGAYAFWGMGLSHSLEMAGETASFTSLTGTTTSQQNTVLSYTYYPSVTSKYRLATNGVTGDDSDSDGGRMMGLGGSLTKYGKRAVMFVDLDVYQTNYANYPLYSSTWVSTGKGLTATQVTPKVAFSFARGKYTANASANIITLSDSAYNGDKGFVSSTFGVGAHRMRWSTTLDLLVGKEAFAVRDGGFTMYNSPSVYKSGWKLGGAFYYSYQTHFMASYSARTYEETSADASVSGMTVKLKHSF